MFNINDFKNLKEKDRYESMVYALDGITSGDGEKDITKLSNSTAVINSILTRANWCGFYININEILELGPFQGRPACTKIPLNKGVCGACATERKTILVENVHNFPGHIACDPLTNSEIVLPIEKDNKLYAVLDIDSEEVGRFTELEKEYLEKCVHILIKNINWEKVLDYYK